MNAVDMLKYGQLTVLRALDGFPESAWETPGACGIWSVKEIIAHLASYEQVLVDVLTTFLGGGPTPYLTRFSASHTRLHTWCVTAIHWLLSTAVAQPLPGGDCQGPGAHSSPPGTTPRSSLMRLSLVGQTSNWRMRHNS